MTTVSKRELNQQTAAVLAAVDAGGAVIVTERGVARWRIEPAGDGRDPVDRMRQDGRIRASRPEPTPWPTEDPTDRRTPADVDRLFDESRGEH